MHIGNSDPTSPFETDPHDKVVDVKIGGTLNVGVPQYNPPGAYSGTFVVTFMTE
ncbi:MAG: DUF4402 domain-containing protein [Bacteroidetes bacterium]|nr:DUF4402 domain-containing protein [Bacteroidota bacterium]